MSIALIGFAHLDVIGNTEDFGKNINKIGVCDFVIVGCMFNILNFLSTKAYLMTFLKEKTFASDWIIKELNKLLVLLFLKTHFLGHLPNKNLVSAISDISIDRFDIKEEEIN